MLPFVLEVLEHLRQIIRSSYYVKLYYKKIKMFFVQSAITASIAEFCYSFTWTTIREFAKESLDSSRRQTQK